MADYLINLFGNVCELFIILFFLNDNYKPRFNKAKFVVLCILFTLFQFANTSLFLGKSLLVILGSFIFILLVGSLYNIKLLHRIVFSVFNFILNALSETIVGMLLASVFDVEITYLQNTPLLFAICTLASKFLTYIFVLMTKRKWFFNNSNPIKRKFLLVLILPISTFLILLVMLRCCYLINEVGFHVIMFVSSIVLVLSNIAVFFIINEQSELIATKEKLLFAERHIKNQAIHYRELYKYQNELRMFRHDIKNRLVALMAMIREGRSEKAIKAMEKDLDFLEEINSNVVNSGNPVIDAILQSKLHAAKERGTVLQISTSFSEIIKIDELELGIILGNALDNAIEAVDKISDKEKRIIKLNIISTDDRISVSVTNHVLNDVDITNLTTTKPDKEKHGYGIKSIQDIVQKYNGFVSFSCENRLFTTSVNIANYC